MPPDDLTDLERRLTGWRPNPAGLNPDAMLFAAGRAAARPWRAWLALAPCLAALAVAVAAWASERAERVALAEQLRQRAPAPALVPPDEPPDSDVPEPRGTTLMPLSWQYFRTCDTCSVVSGNTTTIGGWR